MNKRLPRATPESQGVASGAVADFVRAMAAVPHPNSLMLVRHGAVIAEGWWRPYRPELRHQLFSLSKSFTSTAIGLAAAEGRLSVHNRVLDFFPDDAPPMLSAHLAAMTIEHLLTMTSGHAQDVTEGTLSRSDRNAPRAFLAQPLAHPPGTQFVYNSAATFMLSAILQTVTGQSVLDYLTPRLLGPLEIEGATWDSYPSHDGAWVNFGGWGLTMTTEDVACFGQLYLQRGIWRGQQLVPAEWVDAATAVQVSNGAPAPSDWVQGYGYQFWRCQPPGVYRADGAFGQLCVVMPEQGAVLAATAAVDDMQAVLSALWDVLLPALQTDADGSSRAAVDVPERCAHLGLDPLVGIAPPPLAAAASGKTYAFEPNADALGTLRFDFDKGELAYTTTAEQHRRSPYVLAFADGDWVEGHACLGVIEPAPNAFFAAPDPTPVAVTGAWQSADTFVMRICQIESPFMFTLTCGFVDDQLMLNIRANLSFGPLERAKLVGRRMP